MGHRQRRQQEYVDCLVRNATHPDVESITLLVEGAEAYAHFRHTFLTPSAFLEHAAGHRTRRGGEGGRGGVADEAAAAMAACTVPSSFCHTHLRKMVPLLYSPSPRYNTMGHDMPVYAELFHAANQLLPGKLSMVCNADVSLSHTAFRGVGALQQLFQWERFGRKVALALTRCEDDPADGPATAPLITDYRGSHDAFLFRAPVPQDFLDSVTHRQNSYQAENVVIHEFQRQGYTVLNPCLDLRLVHHHAAEVRQWFPSVDPSRYGLAPPMTIRECLAELSR